MTREEAEKLAVIFATVDGGCSVCVRQVCYEANAAGLGWYWHHDDDDYEVPVKVSSDPPHPAE